MADKEKFDIAKYNLKAHDLFEIGKSISVRTEDSKKEAEKKLAELTKILADGHEALKDTTLTPAQVREVKRALDRLEIAKNFLSKTLGLFTAAETYKKDAEESLARKRKEKETLIESRRKEKRAHQSPPPAAAVAAPAKK